MTLTALDEYDVKMSFQAMDEEKINRITVQSLHTIFLGLGFQPKQLTLNQMRDKVSKAIERRRASFTSPTSSEDFTLLDADVNGDESFIPLPLVKEILAGHSRDRKAEMDRCFGLLDQSGKGFVTASDLQRLSKEMGEPLSAEEAEVLLSTDQMSRQDFRRVFSPPSP